MAVSDIDMEFIKDMADHEVVSKKEIAHRCINFYYLAWCDTK